MNRSDLHHFQENAVAFTIKRKRVMLNLDMGLGKTVITETVISDFLDSFTIDRALVIAPLRVANNVWKQEAEKWDHLKHLKIEICSGLSSKARLEALHTNADIHVLNKDLVPWLIKNLERWRWDMVVIDESSAFKSHSAKRFRALKSVIHYARSVVLLTGTPSPNGMQDLWSQIYLLDHGERLGRNISMFRQRWCDRHYMGWGWTVRPGADEQIKSAIKDIAVYMAAEDYLELPERIDLREEIELPAQTREQYDELEREFLLSLEGDAAIEVPSEAVMANKLLQICNGAIYDEEKNWHELHSEKIERLKEIVEDNTGENFLVAYSYKSDLARLHKAFPNAKVLTDKNIKAWNRGEIKMLFAHPASAGHGLNLQAGGSIIVWFGMPWSLEHYQQFNARLHRQGQKKVVRVIKIIARDTIDERVCKALDSKAATQNDLLNFLKRDFR